MQSSSIHSSVESAIAKEAREACVAAYRMRHHGAFAFGVRDWSKLRIEVEALHARGFEVRLHGASAQGGLAAYVDNRIGMKGVTVKGMD